MREIIFEKDAMEEYNLWKKENKNISGRITREHRLVYKVTGNSVIIVSCKYHY